MTCIKPFCGCKKFKKLDNPSFKRGSIEIEGVVCTKCGQRQLREKKPRVKKQKPKQED